MVSTLWSSSILSGDLKKGYGVLQDALPKGGFRQLSYPSGASGPQVSRFDRKRCSWHKPQYFTDLNCCEIKRHPYEPQEGPPLANRCVDGFSPTSTPFYNMGLHGFTVVSSPLQLSGPFLQGHPPKQVATCWTWCAAHIPSFPSSSDMVCLLSNHGKA